MSIPEHVVGLFDAGFSPVLPVTGTSGPRAQNVLNKDLVLDLWWAAGVWDRVKSAAEHDRERLDEPRLHENFQALAETADAQSR